MYNNTAVPDGSVVKAGCIWDMECTVMIWRSRASALVGSNLGWVELLSRSYVKQIYSFLCLRSTRLDIRPYIKWAVSLVIENDHFIIFLRGYMGFFFYYLCLRGFINTISSLTHPSTSNEGLKQYNEASKRNDCRNCVVILRLYLFLFLYSVKITSL